MVWSKLADEVLDHPKIARAGVIGWAVWSASIVWSNRNLTDGHIPRAAARRLLDLSDLAADVLSLSDAPEATLNRALDAASELPDIRVDAIARRLVECGLWEETEDGWLIHDFHAHNPSRAQVEETRRAKSDAGRSGASRRWKMAHAIAPAMGGAMAPAKQVPKQNDGRAIAEHIANRWQNDAPDPVPDPVPSEKGGVSGNVGDRLTDGSVAPAPDPAPKPPAPPSAGIPDWQSILSAESGGRIDPTAGSAALMVGMREAIMASGYTRADLEALGRHAKAGALERLVRGKSARKTLTLGDLHGFNGDWSPLADAIVEAREADRRRAQNAVRPITPTIRAPTMEELRAGIEGLKRAIGKAS